MSRRPRTRRGVSSIELALVLPVLLAFLLAIIDWSLYMYERLDVGVVVARSVRLAAGDPDPVGTAVASVCGALPTYALACADGDVEARIVDLPSGPSLQVSLTLPFTPAIGLIPTPKTLYASASTGWYGTEPAEP